jgi:RHS repeat-associated protein
MVVQHYPSGITQTWAFDNAGNPTSLVYNINGTVLNYSEAYDTHDRVINATTPLNVENYTYDNANRLTTTQDVDNGTCDTWVYSYDLNSNRTEAAVHGNAGLNTCTTANSPWWDPTYTYDNADRTNTTGYVYDALGRTTTVPSGDVQWNSGDITIAYYVNDFVASQTQSGGTVSYVLDPQGNRVWTSTDANGVTSTNYYADSSDNSAGVSRSDGTWASYYTGIGGMLAGVVDSSGNSELQLPDMQGGVGAQVWNDSSVTWTDSVGAYKDFGLFDYDSGWNSPYGWKGAHQRDNSGPAGIMLMGQRLYNPLTGRFLQTDPIPGGSANAYDYCDQDPINCNDLNGQWGIHINWKKVIRAAAEIAIGAVIVAVACGATAVVCAVVIAAEWGAATSLFNYTADHQNPTLPGAAEAVAEGATIGAVSRGSAYGVSGGSTTSWLKVGTTGVTTGVKKVSGYIASGARKWLG